MLTKSDIWILGILIVLALAVALLQATTIAPTTLHPREHHIRATLNAYMIKAQDSKTGLDKDAPCSIAHAATQWQFEGASRRFGSQLNKSRRLQLLTMTTKQSRNLRLRFIVQETQKDIWAITACAVIDELRDA